MNMNKLAVGSLALAAAVCASPSVVHASGTYVPEVYHPPFTFAQLQATDTADSVVRSVPPDGSNFVAEQLKADLNRTVVRYFNGDGFGGPPNLDLFSRTSTATFTHNFDGKALTKQEVVGVVAGGVAGIDAFAQSPIVNLAATLSLDGQVPAIFSGTVFFYVRYEFNGGPDGTTVPVQFLLQFDAQFTSNPDPESRGDFPFILTGNGSSRAVYPDVPGDTLTNAPAVQAELVALLASIGSSPAQFRDNVGADGKTVFSNPPDSF